jgi:hypothetical protein
VPALQFTTALDPAGQYAPLRHTEHSAKPENEYLPAGHVAVTMDKPDALQYAPAGQARQFDPPTLG